MVPKTRIIYNTTIDNNYGHSVKTKVMNYKRNNDSNDDRHDHNKKSYSRKSLECRHCVTQETI